ncbi:Aspartyl protease family protein 2 [Linum grandiflorum]
MGQMLDISSQVFRKMYREGVAVDSGTEVTMLSTEAFDVVVTEVKKLASSILTEAPKHGVFETCYKGLVNVEATGFPVMGLHFMDDAVLEIDHRGMFLQVDSNTFCLAFLRSSLDLNIIGMMAQQSYNVGYDLKESRIFFEDIDCQILVERL